VEESSACRRRPTSRHLAGDQAAVRPSASRLPATMRPGRDPRPLAAATAAASAGGASATGLSSFALYSHLSYVQRWPKKGHSWKYRLKHWTSSPKFSVVFSAILFLWTCAKNLKIRQHSKPQSYIRWRTEDVDKWNTFLCQHLCSLLATATRN